MTFGDFEYERTDSGVKITRYQGSASSVNIPAQIDGSPVREIAGGFFEGAFSNCEFLTSVVIPNSVTSIGNLAFKNCTSLTSVVIPDSVTTIGDRAFWDCKSLTSVVIPDSVTSIGDRAFWDCKSLTRIVIPDSVTSIGDYAFRSCSSLTRIVIPNSVTTIGGGAFSGCKSLRSVVIPNSVTTIGGGAFSGCKSLRSVVIPNSVTTIGENAFSGCKSLGSVVIPNSVTTIGENAFSGCESLTSLVIPNSVTKIGERAFESSLKNVLICNPNTSTYRAFDKHTDITYVRFPKSLMKSAVFKNTLQNCRDDYSKIRYCKFLNNFFDKIRRLKNASNLPDDIHTSVKQIETLVLSNRCTTAVFNGTDSILDDFLTIQELQQKIETGSVINLITLVNGVSQKKITNALKYVQSINDEIDKIKVAAQENLHALTGEKPAAKRQTAPVTNRPANERQSTPVSNISDTDDKNRKIYETFQALNKGRTVTSRPRQNPVPGVANSASVQDNLPNEDFSIEYNPVGITIKKYNGSADFVNIPSQINGLPVTKIGDWAFYGCTSLKSVVIPDSVTSIGNGAFKDCTSLTSVVIPDSVTTIDYWAFYGCKSLTSVVIPDSVTSIGGNAFYGCTSLTSVVIPNSVTSIDYSAFADCTSLTSIVIPNSVTSIGNLAFRNCTSLTSVVIPDSVTTIGNGAFKDCTSLTSVVIPDSVTTIDYWAFYGCKSLTSIVIPDSVTTIGNEAFRGCSSLTSVVIPNSVTIISGSAFYGCKSLTSIVIPNSVTIISGSVFYGCKSLKTIYFPRALMDVNGRDNTLKDFRNEYNDKIRYYNTVSEIKELMESPDFEKENVSNSDFKYTRTRSGIHIDEYVGFDTYVPVPEEIEGLPVTSIGYRAFDNENLYKVIIPASVQTIVYAAFVSKQSMHVLFKGESIQLTPQSFIAPKITFYFYNAIIYDSIYPITKNNPKYVIHYDAMDFRMV